MCDTIANDVKNGKILFSQLDKHYRKNIQVIYAAIGIHISNITYIPIRFKRKLMKRKEFVLNILRISDQALMYASKTLRDDEEVVRCSRYTLKYASKRLRSDVRFVLQAVRYWPPEFRYVSDELKDNEEVVWCALKYLNGKYAYLLNIASDRIRNNRDFIIKLMKHT